MSSRKLDELATDIDDAKTTVDEITEAPDSDHADRLEELDNTLQHAKDTIDDLDKDDDK